VLILGKGMKWETISVNPKDVEFLAGRKENRQAVLAALGVPPVMVGLLEHAKYDNYALQVEAFHRDTVLPKVQRIEACLESFYLPLFDDLVTEEGYVYRIEFDRSALTLESEDRLTDRVVKQLSHGLITLDQAVQKLGGEPLEGEEGERRFMVNNLVPLEDVAAEPNLEGAADAAARGVAGLAGAVGEEVEEIKRRLADLDEQVAEL